MADKRFLEKELVFNLKSFLDSSLYESLADLVLDNSNSDSATLLNNSRIFQTSTTNCQPTYHTLMSSSFSSSYVQEKLVQILNKDIPIRKQQ